jgi:hypothetical protein
MATNNNTPAPTAKATREKLVNSVLRDWNRAVTTEKISINAAGSSIYAFGNQKAIDQLYAYYNKGTETPNPKTKKYYSENAETWVFALETNFIIVG